MKKFLIVLACFFLLAFEAGSVQSTQTSKVWICTGTGAYAYHNNRACSGLNNCKATIIQVTEKEAIEKWGRKKCKKCYNLNESLICVDYINTEDAGTLTPYNLESPNPNI